MPMKIFGIEFYTKREIDQKETGGFGAALNSRNACIVAVLQADWTLQVGGDLDTWYYADIIHGRSTATLAYASAFKGADDYIHICAGVNDVQQTQSSTTVRIWLQDEPQYDLLFLVVYA